ncbi:MAG: hypothetical protein HQL37_02295 [Alphaproteobacteria bacterium]|nr:hypothetical protein [Alphaproteobacteria bacterium]
MSVVGIVRSVRIDTTKIGNTLFAAKQALFPIFLLSTVAFMSPSMETMAMDNNVTATSVSMRNSLASARANLVALLDYNDKTSPGKRYIQMNDASQALDYILSNPVVDIADKKALNEFKEIWVAFKTTREREIIPALLDARNEDAKRLAFGVQKERLESMTKLLDKLDKK